MNQLVGILQVAHDEFSWWWFEKSMTVCSLILVNYPQMAELFRLVKYDNLPTCMFGMRIQTVYFVFRGNDMFFSEHARLIPGAYHHKILLC